MVRARRLFVLSLFIGSFSGCSCSDEKLAPAELAGLLVLDPENLDFGSVDVGSTNELFVSVRNDGKGPLAIISAAADGTPFVMRSQDAASEVLSEGQRASFKVTFTPNAPGLVEGTIAIAHDGLNGPITTLFVRGTGIEKTPPRVAFDVEPPMLDFGSMPAGDSRTMMFAVRNTGDAMLDISQISLETGREYSLRATQNLPAQIAAGGVLPVEVTYLGAAIGQNLGRAIVSTNAEQPTKAVELRGEAYGSELDISPPALEFGVVGISSLATAKKITVRNIGNRPLLI